jgi:hypothetical protein
MTSKSEAPASTVNIGRLKQWVLQSLPRESKLRELILSEKEILTVAEFVVKLETWLRRGCCLQRTIDRTDVSLVGEED